MCELLALTSKQPHPLNGILQTFYKRSPGHPHGWGIGLFNEDDSFVQKEPKRAIDSTQLREILSHPLEYKTALGHIRYATTGEMILENTHPFVKTDASGREWVLMHNGTIINAPQLEVYEQLQNGDTDSERIFLYLIDNINKKIKNKGRDLTESERFETVEEVISTIADEKNKLNIILYDGEQLYAQANGEDQMYYATDGDTTLISTCPLETDELNLDWKKLPIMQVHAFKDGHFVHSGKVHGKQYIPDPELELYLYNKYAHLSA